MKSKDSVQSKLKIMDCLLILVAFIWGLNYVIAKIALTEMHPLVFNSIRFLIGSTVSWSILLYIEKDYRVSKIELIQLAILGMGIHSFNQLAFIYGVARTSAAATSLIMASTPVWVAIFAYYLKLDTINYKVWIGITASFIGTFFVVIQFESGISITDSNLVGNLLIVIATIFWSLYTIFVKRYFSQTSIIKVTAYSLSFAALFFAVVSVKELMVTNWSAYSLQAWLSAVYSGTFVFGISYMLWNRGIKEVGPTRTSVYSNLPPFISILFGWILLNEIITMTQLFGGLLIMLGLNTVNRNKIVNLKSN